MPKNNPSKKLHYVPKTYLRPFTFYGQTHVWCYDKSRQKTYQSNVKDILFHKDFYKISDGTTLENLALIGSAKDLDVEIFFSKLEKDFAKIRSILIKDAVEHQRLAIAIKEWLTVYIYLQSLRTTDIRKSYRDMAYAANVSALQLANKILVEDKRVPEDLIPKVALRSANKIAGDTDRIIEFIFDEKLCEMYISRLSELSWTILIADDDAHFITSDHPIQNLSSSDKEMHGVGIASKNIEVFFPLTPKYALVLNDKQGENRNSLGDFNVYKISRDYIEEYNRLQVIRANRYIISNTDVTEFCSRIMGDKVNIPSALILDNGDGNLLGNLIAVDGRYKYMLIDRALLPEDE